VCGEHSVESGEGDVQEEDTPHYQEFPREDDEEEGDSIHCWCGGEWMGVGIVWIYYSTWNGRNDIDKDI
jgi:hypothetical protein